MTLPKKGSRTIFVDDCEYRFIVTGNDMVIDVIVEREGVQGQKLTATFDYHNELPDLEMKPQERNITPSTIRELVQHALTIGWEPESQGKPTYKVNGEFIVPLQENK